MSAIAQASAAGGRRRARSVPDRLLGAAGVGMVLLAIVLLLRGGAEEGSQFHVRSLCVSRPYYRAGHVNAR